MVSLGKKWTTKGFLTEELPVDGSLVQAVDDLRGLESLRSEWNTLFESLEHPSACASYEWVVSWWEAFGERADGAGENTRLFVLSVRSATGELVGVVPLFEDLPTEWLEVRKVRLVGDLGHDGVFGMTEEPTLLIAPGQDAYVLKEVGKKLQEGFASRRWDFVGFRTLQDGEVCSLPAAFGRVVSGTWIKSDQRSGSDYAVLLESWAEYRKGLSKSMRDNLGYYPRLLTRDGHDWHVRYVRDAFQIGAAADRLTELHRARAESQRGQHHCNHIAGGAQELFLATLMRRLSERGEAFIAELVVDGEVVASQAFIEQGRDLTVFYSGYLDAWYKYSPIFVIDSVVFRDTLERGVRRLDFLLNSGQWKSRWGAKPGAPLRRSTLVARHPISVLRYGLYLGRQGVRRNITERIPVIQRRLAGRIQAFCDRSARALLPLFPVISRHATRMAPNLHLAVRLVPLHHH